MTQNRIHWSALFLLVLVGCAAGQQLFDIKPVADGVYAAIAKPAYRTNCNAAIVILDDSVLVVDTHSKPSAARGLIAQIKTLTDKPVKYVVNTHFHWDHYQGNQAYPSSWPAGVEIISSEATRESIEERGIPRVRRELVTMPPEIEKLRGQLEEASDAKQREELQSNLRQAEDYLAELKSMQVTLPTMTFDHSLILHRKSRTVEVLWLGKAHTDGDVFVYLPKERVLVTGDALHGWTPYMGDSYPYDWIRTLDEAEKLDFQNVIGGHGDIIEGKEKFELWKQYFHDLMEETAQAYSEGASEDEAAKRVSKFLTAKYAAKFDPTFPQRVVANVAKAYQVIAFAHN
jgi:glyoxylase-like metal-dependent hydrolase (beta-lactamase superfamily II)